MARRGVSGLPDLFAPPQPVAAPQTLPVALISRPGMPMLPEADLSDDNWPQPSVCRWFAAIWRQHGFGSLDPSYALACEQRAVAMDELAEKQQAARDAWHDGQCVDDGE